MEAISEHVNNFEKKLQKFNESILDTFMFQISTLQAVGEKQMQKTNKTVKDYRKKEWTRAFEKAEGDVDKAYEEYTKDAFFC